MSKSSKSCAYTGHMKIMNRTNPTKAAYNSMQSKSQHTQPTAFHHVKRRPEYPEVAAEQRAQAKCNCKL